MDNEEEEGDKDSDVGQLLKSSVSPSGPRLRRRLGAVHEG